MRSLAEVLSDDNRALLKIIHESKPQSIASLADIAGRKPGNLSRTLKTMSNYGLVEMKRENRHVRPIVKNTEFRIVARFCSRLLCAMNEARVTASTRVASMSR